MWRLLDEHGGIFRLQSNPWDRTNVEGKVQLEKNLPTDRVVLPSPLFWPLLFRLLDHLSKLEEGMDEDIVLLVGKNLVLFDVCRQAVLCSHWPSIWQPSLVSGFHVIIFCSHCASSSNIVIMISNIITTILIVRMKNGSTSPRASSNRQLLSFPCHVDQIPANSQ